MVADNQTSRAILLHAGDAAGAVEHWDRKFTVRIW
jgi:hypothetical protein